VYNEQLFFLADKDLNSLFVSETDVLLAYEPMKMLKFPPTFGYLKLVVECCRLDETSFAASKLENPRPSPLLRASHARYILGAGALSRKRRVKPGLWYPGLSRTVIHSALRMKCRVLEGCWQGKDLQKSQGRVEGISFEVGKPSASVPGAVSLSMEELVTSNRQLRGAEPRLPGLPVHTCVAKAMDRTPFQQHE
jgi:hypothetical protein